jgi:hypothetical protein
MQGPQLLIKYSSTGSRFGRSLETTIVAFNGKAERVLTQRGHLSIASRHLF